MHTESAARFIWYPLEIGTVLPRTSKLRGRRILVLGSEAASASALVQALHFHGAVAAWSTPGASAEEAGRIAVAAMGPVDGIIDLNLYGQPFACDSLDAWQPAVRHSIAVLQACYDEWLGITDANRVFYVAVTQMGGRMGYDGVTVRQPLGGIWAGLAKTLPQELPNCNIRVIDVDDREPEVLAETVVRELYNWGLFEIGWCGTRRFTLSARHEESSADIREFTPADTIVLSGGGRGIGFRLAEHLAGTCGSHVIISGRESLPDTQARWIGMDEKKFREYEHELFKDAAHTGMIPAARAQIDRQRRTRELVRNLQQVQERSLRIEYRQCDITDERQVSALFRDIDTPIAAVIHNAGVDSPIRLSRKSADSFIRTVGTKIYGFFHLLTAARERYIGLFCSVGSLTGRWGGMLGETDYAAANEGLTRCGMCASGRFRIPIKTICWPTWDRVGMIKNFEVASAYMTPLDIEEGLAHWHRELRCLGPAEVTFVGNVGSALTPVQLKGFPPAPDLPNLPALYSKLHFLGEVTKFEPCSELVSECVLQSHDSPALNDFYVNGHASVPVSILLEYATAAAEWIRPGPREPLYLREIIEVQVLIRELYIDSGEFRFERRLSGTLSESDWLVHVHIRRLGVDKPVLIATLRYTRDALPQVTEPHVTKIYPLSFRPQAALYWKGLILNRAQWSSAAAAPNVITARVNRLHNADLWVGSVTPISQLPVAALENIFIATATYATARDLDTLQIGSISFFASGEPVQLAGDPSRGVWKALDGAGNVSFRVRKIALNGNQKPRREPEVETALASR